MKAFFMFLVNVSFFCFVVAMGLVYIPKTNGYSELLSHFATFFSIISLCYVIFYLFFNCKYLAIASFIMCIVTAYPLMPLILPTGKAPEVSAGSELSLLQFNIWNRIETVEPLLNLIKEKGFPDIVIFQEVTPDLLNKLQSLNAIYPYRFDAPEDGAYGMAIYSKVPMSNVIRKNFRINNNSYTVADFQKSEDSAPFTIVELHAFSPAGDMHMNQRRQELREISKVIKKLPGKHKMLIGDLNTTPYSPYFVKLLKASGLKNSMQGRRIVGTWPNFIPFFLRIPIDHLLVSRDIYVVKQEVCPEVGSDHLPVLTYIKIKD